MWQAAVADPTVVEIERLGGIVSYETAADGKRECSAYLGNQWVGGNEKLALLTQLSNLTTVYIESRHVTDEGMALVAGLQDLQVLHLTAPKVTDRGAADLAKLPRLRELYLSQVQLTDAGLEALAELDLSRLYLTYTQVTDQSVDRLKDMKSLSAVDVYGTEFTEQGVAALQEARPGLEIGFAEIDQAAGQPIR